MTIAPDPDRAWDLRPSLTENFLRALFPAEWVGISALSARAVFEPGTALF
jgi:hypothetical protein